MKMSLDTWASFARTFNPNPSPAFLAARGFTDVAAQFAAQGEWQATTTKNLNKSPLRQLMWPSFMTGFKEGAQCDFFDYPLNYYEEHPATA